MRNFTPSKLSKFLAFVYQSFCQHDGYTTAKSLTYTSLFAVVPLLTLVLAILAAFPTFQIFAEQIQAWLFARLLPSTGNDLQNYLATFADQARNLTWIGAVMLFVTSFLMLQGIEQCFNHIWGVRDQRKGLASFLLYWSVLSLGPLLLGLGFAISSYLTSLSLFARFSQLTAGIGVNAAFLQLFPTLLTTGAFTLLYAAVPNCKVKLRYAFLGALAVALTFKVVKWVFTKSIATTSYELVYGTFAALPIFLLWLYMCWVVILLGANLVRSIPVFLASHDSEEVHPTLLALAVLHTLWQRQMHGATLKLGELQNEEWPFKTIEPTKLLGVLEDLHLVRAVEDDEYMLAVDLDNLTLLEIFMKLPWALPAATVFKQTLPPAIAKHLPSNDILRVHYLRLAQMADRELAFTVGHYFKTG